MANDEIKKDGFQPVYVSFSQKEKADAFDRIMERYYNKNFGQILKSDIDLIMFDIYIKKMIKENVNEDKVLNYNKCSDYIIAKELGLTQQRVRNYKIRSQLVYPVSEEDFKWRKSFASIVKNARYDRDTHKVSISIPDPNLYYEIQNYLEENGFYIEMQFNSKLMIMRIEFFVELLVAIEDEEERKEIIKKLKKQFAENGKTEKEIEKEGIGKALIGVVKKKVKENAIKEMSAGIAGLFTKYGPDFMEKLSEWIQLIQ